jgi:branched-chain amino acid transport system substrate-binding protein
MITHVAKVFFTLMFVATIAHALAAPSGQRAKIGVILPLSGDFSVLGEACKNGALIAASELMADGVELDLKIEDSPGCRAITSLSAYHKLKTSDDVRVFFGFVSPEEVAAIGPVAERDGSALVAIGAPKTKPKNSLLVWMSPEVEARRLAAEVYRKHPDVAILSADQQWERDVSDAFEQEFIKLGGRVSLRVEAPFTSKDLRSEVLKVKRSSATAVVIPPYSLFSTYTKALQRSGVTAPIYGIELDQAAIDDSQGAAEGAVIIRPSSPDESFQKKYSSRFFGHSADIPASQCYDGLKILGDAVKSGATSGSDFGRYFQSLSRFAGASGDIDFEPGRTVFTTEFVTVSGGRLTKTK